jgi:hypothetical protein
MRDWQAMAKLVHKVKGAARIIRADGLVAACEQLGLCFYEWPGEEWLDQSYQNFVRNMQVLCHGVSFYLDSGSAAANRVPMLFDGLD